MGKRSELQISGGNFHGPYRATFRGPAAGFVLSDSQARRYWDTLCGLSGCTCGGGYGDGPDPDSANAITSADEVPANCPPDLARALAAAEREYHASNARREFPILLLPSR